MENELNNNESPNVGDGRINNNADFWKDAQEFLNTQLSKEYEENLKQFIISKGYNKNEIRFLNKNIQDAIEFKGVIVALKCFYN